MKKKLQLLVLGLVFVVGILLDLAPIRVPDGIDKIYHFIGFSLITILAISTYISFFGKKWINLFLMSLLIFGGIFGGISEFLQKYVAIRDCSFQDWITNLCGVTLIVVIAFLNGSRERKKIESNESQFEFKDLPINL